MAWGNVKMYVRNCEHEPKHEYTDRDVCIKLTMDALGKWLDKPFSK